MNSHRRFLINIFLYFSEPGCFNGFNLPGNGLDHQVVGHFSGNGSVQAKIQTMTLKWEESTIQEMPFSQLLDCMLFISNPNDINIIAMTHPSAFIVGSDAIVSFCNFLFIFKKKCDQLLIFTHYLKINIFLQYCILLWYWINQSINLKNIYHL